MTAANGRRFAFWYALAGVVTLFLLAGFYAHGSFRVALRGVPFAAVASVWAGVLGALTISLKGVYEHGFNGSEHPSRKSEWTNELFLWHLGRPVSGAVVGVAVFIVFQAVYPSGNPTPAALAAASFVLGIQEKRFFDWIKQIGAAVITIPGNKAKPQETDGHAN